MKYLIPILKDEISINIAYKGTYTKVYTRILFW